MQTAITNLALRPLGLNWTSTQFSQRHLHRSQSAANSAASGLTDSQQPAHLFSEVHHSGNLEKPQLLCQALSWASCRLLPHPTPTSQACPSIGQAVGYSEPGFVPVSCWPPCQPGEGAGTDLIWQLRKPVVGTGWERGGGAQNTHPRKEINSLRRSLCRMGETQSGMGKS